ncbi:MAG: hypothetical protein AB9897_01320 [Anaerolineaceae bacterium]
MAIEIRVIALQSFSARVGEEIISVAKGKTVMMPAGADWVKAGLAKNVDFETAAQQAPENAAKTTGSAPRNRHK